MSTSSAQTDYLTISNDTITLSDITVSNGAGSSYYYTTGARVTGSNVSTITLSGGGSGYTIGAAGSSSTITFTGAGGSGGFIAQDISTIDPAAFTWKSPEEFVDTFPDFSRIQKMCEEYPGLKIAYEKFVTTYKLVKDDYDTPKDKRPLP